MKCEHCNNELVWVGSLRSGALVCPHCDGLEGGEPDDGGYDMHMVGGGTIHVPKGAVVISVGGGAGGGCSSSIGTVFGAGGSSGAQAGVGAGGGGASADRNGAIGSNGQAGNYAPIPTPGSAPCTPPPYANCDICAGDGDICIC